MPDLKWVDVGYREYFEVTTRKMQYWWRGELDVDGSPIRKCGEKQWVAQVLRGVEWVTIGEFLSGMEAKLAAIKAFSEAPNA